MSMFELINGDCLEEMKKIPDGSIDLVLTDPPYGTTQNKWDTVIDLQLMWEQINRVVKPNAPTLLFAQTPFDKKLGTSNIEHLKYEWIWQKEQGTGHLNAKKMPLKDHENILVFYNKLPTYNPQMIGEEERRVTRSGNVSKTTNYGSFTEIAESTYKGRYPKSIYKCHKENGLHPTQKPVALMEYLIKTYTNEGETVLDFTMGSGTTGVACKNLNRNFIGIELDKEYYEIAKQRIGV